MRRPPLSPLVFRIAILSATAAQADVIRVGSGPGCDVATLAGALAQASGNGPGPDEIRLPEGTMNDLAAPIAISDQSLALRGGFLSCFAVQGGGVTQLHGDAGVLRIAAPAGAARTIEIEGMELSASTARVIDVDGDAALTLLDTGVSGGHAMAGPEGNQGGGVRLQNGAGLVLGGSSSIDHNLAAGGGGGVYCNAGSVVIGHGSRIARNGSLGDGGGLYLDHCSLDDASGGGEFGDAGIVANSAAQRGGGIFADTNRRRKHPAVDRRLVRVRLLRREEIDRNRWRCNRLGQAIVRRRIQPRRIDLGACRQRHNQVDDAA